MLAWKLSSVAQRRPAILTRVAKETCRGKIAVVERHMAGALVAAGKRPVTAGLASHPYQP